MIGQTIAVPDESFWEQEYALLMETARKHRDPAWEHGEVVVLKTARGNLYVAEIPNYRDAAVREPLEDRCIQKMADAEDTEVFSCLATINGSVPEILSWNFRSRLVALNPNNLRTAAFLWGGGDVIHIRSFADLLPPKQS